MTDIVIPLGWRSEWKNNELRYSLRSFEKYLSGIGKIFIVTDLSGLPKFLKDVIHIPYPDMSNNELDNTTKKVIRACTDERVSQKFLLSNDDFFLLKPFEASTFPYYYSGDLTDDVKLRGKVDYSESLINTKRVLETNGFETRNFELHCPMLFDKTKFVQYIAAGCFPRSVYGNVERLQAGKKQDYAIKLPLNLTSPIEDNSVFTVSNGPVNGQMEILFEQLYPVKSRWEQ